MDLSSNGQYNIYVRPGNALRAVENSIIGTATSYTYILYVEEGGIAYIENSTIYGAEPSFEEGLYVKGNGTHIGLLKVINSTVNT